MPTMGVSSKGKVDKSARLNIEGLGVARARVKSLEIISRAERSPTDGIHVHQFQHIGCVARTEFYKPGNAQCLKQGDASSFCAVAV